MKAHSDWMQLALESARSAAEQGEVPVGAVIVSSDNKLLAVGANRRERDCDPTAHAEIVAIREACRLRQNWRLADCTLYVTLEPCPMCASTILQSRLALLVYGCDDLKAGAIASVIKLPKDPSSFHRLQVISGVEETACQQLLKHWFAQKR